MCIILKIAPFPQILSMAPCEKCEVKIEPPINVVMNEKKMRGQERHHILLFKTLFVRSIFQIFCKVHLGSFKNYVDKMEWVGGQKMPIWVHVQGEKCPLGGRQVVKKGKIMSTYLLNDPFGKQPKFEVSNSINKNLVQQCT